MDYTLPGMEGQEAEELWMADEDQLSIFGYGVIDSKELHPAIALICIDLARSVKIKVANRNVTNAN